MTECERCNREPERGLEFGLCVVCVSYLREQEELRDRFYENTDTDTEQETL